MIIKYEYIAKVRKVHEVEIPDSIIEEAITERIKTGEIETADEFFDSPDIFLEHIDLYDYQMELVYEEDEFADEEDLRIGIADEELSFDEFEEKYVTMENPYNDESNMFNYGEDDDEDLYIETKDDSYVWSVIYEDDETTIVPGKRRVNLVGYYVTEKPWRNKYIIVNEE
jgi:hypothetical protein